MPVNYNFARSRSSSTWRDHLKELKELNDEYARGFSMMSEYERDANGRAVKNARDVKRNVIENGALYEWNQAKENLQQALKEVEQERARIINSYDPVKLSAEMNLAKMRIENAKSSDYGRFDLKAIKAMKEEAMASGDNHKLRAVNEALTSLLSKVEPGDQDEHGQDMRFQANRISNEAKRDLNALMVSDGYIKANEKAMNRVNELTGAKSALIDVAETLGELSPNGVTLFNERIQKAINSVKQDHAGNFIFYE